MDKITCDGYTVTANSQHAEHAYAMGWAAHWRRVAAYHFARQDLRDKASLFVQEAAAWVRQARHIRTEG